MSDAGLPVGTVTFLFTDVVGSTALWEQAPEVMGPAMTRHDELVEDAVTTAGGLLVRPRGEGDSRFAVFIRASDALAGAVGIQRELTAEAWATPKPIVVRIAVHTGEADLRDGDYYGSAVNRCARLRSLAHPGQILVSHATAQVGGAGVVLRDLGTHRLKDLTAPERVHQVDDPDLASEFPPLVSLDAGRHNLPVQITELVGRDAELDELTKRLASERLVTLRGQGGTGKSRLALAVAAELAGRFPDGVWFVELAPISDPDIVASTVAALVADIDDSGDVLDTLGRKLADQRVLIVLDNCEHVIDAAAKLADSLLRQTTNARILATSQEPLRIHGEHVRPIGPLEIDDALHLFSARARATNPAFELDGENLDAVRAICARLDGIPLALELAATRTSSMTATQIAARLDDRFRLLSGGSRSAPERHRTMRAALEWTHDLLTGGEQVLYRRLGVFAGGATCEAIAAICTDDEIVDPFDLDDLLQNLVERSLLIHDPNHDPPRYRMLETILAHARTKLDPAEQKELRDRHLGHFAAPAPAAMAGIRSAEAPLWITRLGADHDNVRAALAWALDGGDPAIGLRAAAQAAVFWDRTGALREAHRWLAALLDATPDVAGRDRVDALVGLAWTLMNLGRSPEARLVAARAVELSDQVGDLALEGESYKVLSAVLQDVSGGREGLEELRRAVALATEAGDGYKAAFEGQALGALLVELDRAEEALQYLDAAERYAVAHQHPRMLAQTVLAGLAHLALGDVDRAVAVVSGQSDRAREIGDLNMAILAETIESECLAAVGDVVSAATLLARATETCIDNEYGYFRDPLLLGAAIVLVPVDGSMAAWLTGAAVSFAEAENRRASPRMERAMFRVESLARAELGDGYDAIWRDGGRAAAGEALARALTALQGAAGGG